MVAVFNRLAKLAGLSFIAIFGFAFAQVEACHDGFCPSVKPKTASVASGRADDFMQKVSFPIQLAPQAQQVQTVPSTPPAPKTSLFDQLPKRSVIYMTAVDEDGRPYSFDFGPIQPPLSVFMAVSLFIVAFVLLYFIFEKPFVRSPVKSNPDPVPDLHLELSEASPTVKSPEPAPVEIQPKVSVPTAVSWGDLVRACNGDTVRAATIINGEVAVDPTLTSDSPVAIARAYTRVTSSRVTLL